MENEVAKDSLANKRPLDEKTSGKDDETSDQQSDLAPDAKIVKIEGEISL